ncbi:MAG: hypothetical protein H6744_00645 [Deltaproteobacteria bacterium]|nr:hypothetical protein [Deltaproteobacteria bacterium]MCB9785173.1 hypothetical protein [Deltaproteobacteria bacterium]
MGDSKSNANLDALDAMLESEKRVASSQPGKTADPLDDGLVTSAPGADQVGSLLTDLLNEAKKEADRERASLDQKLKVRGDEDRLARQREEALRREQLQKQLQEETRRRNEALTRREREEAAARAAEEERRQRLATETEGLANAQAAKAAPARRSKAPLVVAVLVIAGLAGGLVYTLQPKGVITLSDIKARSAALVADATAQWQAKVAEQERIAALEREAEAAKALAAKSKADAAAARAEKAAAEAKAKEAAEKAEKAAASAEESKSSSGKSSRGSKSSKKGFTLPSGVF